MVEAPDTTLLSSLHAGELANEAVGPRHIGLTAINLCSTVAADVYGELCLLARGYEVDDSAHLQDIPSGRVSRLRQEAIHHLGGSGMTGRARAVATAIDIGFLHDPATVSDEGIPTTRVEDAGKLEVLRLTCEGASIDEIKTILQWSQGKARRMKDELLRTLNARNSAHLPWRGYQARLLRPSAEGIVLPDEYIDKLDTLEGALDAPLVSLPRSEPGFAKKKWETGRERYEEFILDMVQAPNFERYHPRLRAYYKEKYGYTDGQWRSLITHLGGSENGILRTKSAPGHRGTLYAIALDEESLQGDKDQRPSFITERIVAAYEQRRSTSNVQELYRPPLRTDHLNCELSLAAEAALSPTLRTAIALSDPDMRRTDYATGAERMKMLATLTGQTLEEVLAITVALERRRCLVVDTEGRRSDTLIVNRKGMHLIMLGLSELKKEARGR